MKIARRSIIISKILLFLLLIIIYAQENVSMLAAQVKIIVEMSQPGPIISPYIYGQFIEHMGRCIRDGIWAEKLHDRKFLLEPGKSWRLIKPDGTDFDAYLDPAGAYAAPHALALWIKDAKGGKCGILQEGIGLVRNKEYIGYAVLAHVGKPVPVEVRLSWGDNPSDGQSVILNDVDSRYRKFPFYFRSDVTTNTASLSLTLSSPGYLWVGCLSLMPADSIKGMRKDTLELLRRLDATIYRWPGGNFVSGYNWKDGIGDRDRRPPRWDRAWNAVEDNDFGVDEFLAFCREINAEPLIVVNTGLGSVEDAVQLVEYVNGSVENRWGAERLKNEHREPYIVTWWGIGNEMYGKWQLGHVPVERYVVRHNAFVEALRAVDQRIKVVAVGLPGTWNDVMVPECAAYIDLLSGHHYSERKLRIPFTPQDAQKYKENFQAYSNSIALAVRNIVADLRKRQSGESPKIDRILLAIDEYGIVRDWTGTRDDPGVGFFEQYFPLGDAIVVGRGLHEIIRSADIVMMSNWSEAVNVVGAVKTNQNHAVLSSVGHLLALYRAHIGGILMPLKIIGDETIDAVSGYDPEKEILTIGLINFSAEHEVVVNLRLKGVGDLLGSMAWRIDGPELGSFNIPGKTETVTTIELSEPVALDKPIALPPHTITVIEVKVPLAR